MYKHMAVQSRQHRKNLFTMCSHFWSTYGHPVKAKETVPWVFSLNPGICHFSTMKKKFAKGFKFARRFKFKLILSSISDHILSKVINPLFKHSADSHGLNMVHFVWFFLTEVCFKTWKWLIHAKTDSAVAF